MSSGFAIWRKPGEIPLGIKGEFKVSDTVGLHLKDGFVFSPWDESSLCYYLEGNTVTETETLKTWVDNVDSGQSEDMAFMSPSAWGDYIQKIRLKISLGHVQKVVAARQTAVPVLVSLFDAFTAACNCYPEAFVSLVFHPRFGIWLGATPEILIQPADNAWETVSMAGTLLHEGAGWTEKEHEENTATQQFMEQVFQKMGAHIQSAGETEHVRAGALHHLVKRYRFTLNQNKIQELISNLHPTPAVGGLPRNEALSIIAVHEKNSRGLFAGYIGFYQKGNPHLWVNLRCCQWLGENAVLYAGAGINALSDARAEWEETAAKMNTIGSCL
jgi:isochorismate synthase